MTGLRRRLRAAGIQINRDYKGTQMLNLDGYKRNAAGQLLKTGLVDPAHDHDACGVGFVAMIDGVPRHSIVEQGIEVLVNLEHRGAVGGDKVTGDGSGILTAIPDLFFREESGVVLPEPGHYGIGMIFLPSDPKLAETCIQIIEKTVQSEDCEVLGWRDVPTDNGELGALSKTTEPKIRQLFVGTGKHKPENLNRKLYVIRRVCEKTVWDLDDDTSQFYVVSLSTYCLNYKGLLNGSQLGHYFPDLCDRPVAGRYFRVLRRTCRCYGAAHHRPTPIHPHAPSLDVTGGGTAPGLAPDPNLLWHCRGALPGGMDEPGPRGSGKIPLFAGRRLYHGSQVGWIR